MNRIERAAFDLIRTDVSNRDARILELCPGPGNLSRALLGEGFERVEAVDIHPEHFDVPGVKCHRGDLSQPQPFDDGSFDLVVCCEGIEHIENQYAFAAECRRILKDGADLVLTTPNVANFASRLRFLLTGFYSLSVRPLSEFRKDWPTEHIHPLSFWQLRHILHTNGLFIERVVTDHIRKSALLGALFWPLSVLASIIAFRKEKDPRQQAVNRRILWQMNSFPLYFGRTQIVRARKGPTDYEK